MGFTDRISVTGAREHNLRSIDVEFPKNKLIVVTGVSGSGKSSLVFDVIYREAESRYLGTLSSNARQFLGKMKRPDVEKIEGLSPSIAVKQTQAGISQRSTAGTLTGIYDHLRLLFARLGSTGIGRSVHNTGPEKFDRTLFSFNSPAGACPHCKGLGVEDRLDPELLIADPSKTLREGALVITTPNGYIIYSQVTMEVLDQVCRAEGFHVDIPWKDLSGEQQYIVLYGSDKIEIPYGKHPLESRMRWSGITAKPREMGFYKGIIPVMENILQHDRNKNILRFVRTISCSVCKGTRLNERALSVRVMGYDIATLCALQLSELMKVTEEWIFSPREQVVAGPIISKIAVQIRLLEQLGLKYLSTDRESATLSGGELQRLRLATQVMTGLSGILYVFDEPSAGLHPAENRGLIQVLKALRDKGNTVLVVEHDETFIRHADWLIDIGPGPGIYGGKLLISSAAENLADLPPEIIAKSKTMAFFYRNERFEIPLMRRKGSGNMVIKGASENNLKNIEVSFRLEAMNAVTGVSGAGKSTLVNLVLGNFLSNNLHGMREKQGKFRSVTGWEVIGKVVRVDQSPIGRTPRSNPATYSGLFDHVRDLFASQPEARIRKFDKSRFSFNTTGGRCETCQGAGFQQIGMHFMGNVEILCESCEGQRFDPETLAIRYHEKTISDVLEMTVTYALTFFEQETRILSYLMVLDRLGLGYLTLGQRSSTLSGGEAQRVKLATELAKPQASHTLYILEEPTTGLHPADVGNLINALNKLVEQGHTVIFIEHDPALIASADHVIDLGPGSGMEGGQVVATGTPETIMNTPGSLTGNALNEYRMLNSATRHPSSGIEQLPYDIGHPVIALKGVTTNNLKNISLEIPKNKITVLTGVSGSGKSSLAFDTLYAEGQNRYLESYSPYFRSRVGMQEKASCEEVTGLTATFAVDQNMAGSNPRSTVGTTTGIYDLYRLLYSRIGKHSIPYPSSVIRHPSSVVLHPSSSLFSFNHQHGACPSCKGLGFRITCDPWKLINHPECPVSGGAMDGTKTGKFYGDPRGRHVATLLSAGRNHGVDFSVSWNQLDDRAREIVLKGTGDEIYDVTWRFKRGQREGEHHFQESWPGFIALVDEEYIRKHAGHRGESMLNVMKSEQCSECSGTRLRPESLSWLVGGLNIAGLTALSISEATDYFHELIGQIPEKTDREIAEPIVQPVLQKLRFLSGLGLNYLSVDRVSATLSAGESRRIKLAGQLGSGLSGLTYILDEPTMGLHPRDTGRMMKVIRSLRENGNTVVIVEHDRDVILAADHVIDMGPGTGKQGGFILAQGTPEEIAHHPESITAPYLSTGFLPLPPAKRMVRPGLRIHNAFANNLKGFDLEIPAGGLIAVTGVSGSGKSSLLFEVIMASRESGGSIGCSSIEGFQLFRKVVAVLPKSGFSAPAGTPVTYTGMFDPIRNLFACTPDAVRLNFSKNHFSYLNKDGRCAECQGMGKIRIPMDFLADVTMECEQCKGTRYREEILQCKYREHSIDGVLQMTISEAARFFADHKMLAGPLDILEKVGLAYLQLGQSLDTLSGGEAQRLSLAAELIKPVKGPALYLFEEPSTGLHFADIQWLLQLFHQLAEQGNTLLFIEHDPDIISHADWIIELGPEGGDKGGYVVKSESCRN
ncbi:MAG: excinuclease ABC subunit UvrA [Bacteroidota bacterium]